MTSSIEEFDLPNGGDGDGTCSSKTKGFVLHVEKCAEHDHFISLHSDGKSEHTSEKNTDIVAGTDLNLSAKNDLNVTAGRNRVEKIKETSDTTAEKIRFHANVFVKKVLPPAAFDACTVTERVEEEIDGKIEEVSREMIDINKLAAWVGNWVGETEKRIAAIEEKI